MKLKRLWIKKYQILEDLEIVFGDSDYLPPSPNIQLFIGLNGSGKSSALEAIGSIFSHLALGISPGFDFEMEYEIFEYKVMITTYPETSEIPLISTISAAVHVEELKTEKGYYLREWSPELQGLLPDRIVGYSAGPTSDLHWVLSQSVQQWVLQQLGDIELETMPEHMSVAEWDEERKSYEEEAKQRLTMLLDNPRTLFLSSVDAMMAFFPLLLINKSERLSYSRARDNLLELVGIEIDQPIFSFTLKVSGDWATILTKDKKNTFEHFLKQANVCVLIDEVDSMDSEVTNEEAVQDFYAIFDWRVEILGLLLPYNQITPLQLFDEMMAWKRQGALKDLQLVINKVGNQGLLLNSSLSDGEYLLLGRMALLILLQEVNESLIILDEPETHLNDRWKRELISRIYNYLERQDQEKNSHQIIIATHSAITLTDADDSMVVVFKKNEGKVVVRGLASSVFGANLIHVTEEITEENFSVGQFANEWVHQYVDKYRDDKEKLKQLLEIVGPGVLRLYVIEAIRRIKKDVT